LAPVQQLYASSNPRLDSPTSPTTH